MVIRFQNPSGILDTFIPYFDSYGGDRPGMNLYLNGEKVYSFKEKWKGEIQSVYYDRTWDRIEHHANWNGWATACPGLYLEQDKKEFERGIYQAEFFFSHYDNATTNRISFYYNPSIDYKHHWDASEKNGYGDLEIKNKISGGSGDDLKEVNAADINYVFWSNTSETFKLGTSLNEGKYFARFYVYDNNRKEHDLTQFLDFLPLEIKPEIEGQLFIDVPIVLILDEYGLDLENVRKVEFRLFGNNQKGVFRSQIFPKNYLKLPKKEQKRLLKIQREKYPEYRKSFNKK